MAKFDDIEDLVSILEANPEWLEAVRSSLLERERLSMPNTLEDFADSANRFMDSTNRLIDLNEQSLQSTREFVDSTRRLVESTDRFIESASRWFEQAGGRLGNIETSAASSTETVGALAKDVSRLKEDYARIDDRVKALLGTHARNEALREIPFMVMVDMGMRSPRLLEPAEIAELVMSSDTTDISRDDLRSFMKADAIVEAIDKDGAVCYVATEIAYVVDGRHTTRAIRNAWFMTRYTGAKAIAAVMSVHVDTPALDVIDSGQVHWYKLDPRRMDIE